jgi:hypothetical protein
MDLLEAAKEAANKLHADMSVSCQQCVENLTDLIGHIETLRDATQADIDREDC